MLPYDLKNFGQSLVATSIGANNILLYFTSGYWSLAAEYKPLYHTWSLGVEEQYYLITPLIFLALFNLLILFEEANSWFKNFFDEDNYMTRVLEFKEVKKSIVPGVVHLDGTGRLQTVKQEDNPRYYKLIKQFNGITNVPMILITSFNENEPIVCKPEEALDCFLRTKMDILVMENWIIKRN